MVRHVAVIGIVLLLLGGGLFAAYYPNMCYSTAELKMLQNATLTSVTYNTFREGDAITVYGQLTKTSYLGGTIDESWVQLDSVDLTLVVAGNLTKKHIIGDNIQMRAVLVKTTVFGFGNYQVWKVISLNDVQPMILMQGIFIGVAVFGLVLLAVGMKKKRGAAPPRA